MKKIKIVVMLLSLITSKQRYVHAHQPTWIEEAFIAPITTLTHDVLNHYYIIARLKNTIALLKKIPKSVTASISFDNLHKLPHPQINDCINKIKKNNSIEPLFYEWEKILTYRCIYKNDTYITQYCALICAVITIIKNEPICFNTKQYTLDSEKKNHSSEIAFRFFLLHRLKKTYKVLKQQNHSLITNKNWQETRSNNRFTNQHTYSCLNQIALDGNIKPTIDLFNLFNNYHFIEDPIFTKEFLQLIIITLQAIAKKNVPHNQAYCENLSIEELLNIIDVETKKQVAVLATHSSHIKNTTTGISTFLLQLHNRLLMFIKNCIK